LLGSTEHKQISRARRNYHNFDAMVSRIFDGHCAMRNTRENIEHQELRFRVVVSYKDRSDHRFSPVFFINQEESL
jgi:hypothetical protein